MAVNWQLGLVDSGLGAIEAFRAGQSARLQENQLRRQEQQYQRQEQARAQASQQLSTGDTRAAQQTAIAGGDFDFAKAIGSYNDDERKQLDAEAESLGRFASSLRGVPAGQRDAAFRQMAPSLRGRFNAEEIANYYQQFAQDGFSDNALDGIIGQAISVKDALAQSTKANEQYTLAPGSSRYDGKGNLIVAQPFAPQLRSVGEGQTLVEVQPGGGGPASGGGGSSGRYTGGWTPRARNGGDNDDAAVDGKIAGAAQYLGVNPDADISSLTPLQIAQAMTLSEGGRGSLADRNNNPANIKGAGGEGGFRRFSTKQEGLQAAADLVARKIRNGQTTVRSLIEGLPVGGSGGSRVVATGAPKGGWHTLSADEARAAGLPAGPTYQRSPEGQISAVTGTATAGAGGSGLTKTQEGVIRTKLQSIQSIRSQIGRVEAAMKDLDTKGWTGSLGGLVPGALDAESDRFDKAVAGLAPLIRQLTRVPGEGAMSDYESRLAGAGLPTRRDTAAGRKELLDGIKDLLRNTESGYRDLVGGGQRTPTTPASGGWGAARKVK